MLLVFCVVWKNVPEWSFSQLGDSEIDLRTMCPRTCIHNTQFERDLSTNSLSLSLLSQIEPALSASLPKRPQKELFGEIITVAGASKEIYEMKCV